MNYFGCSPPTVLIYLPLTLPSHFAGVRIPQEYTGPDLLTLQDCLRYEKKHLVDSLVYVGVSCCHGVICDEEEGIWAGF